MAYDFRYGGRTHVDLSGEEPVIVGEVPGKYVDLTGRDGFAMGAMPSPRGALMKAGSLIGGAIPGAVMWDIIQDPSKWLGWASKAGSALAGAASYLPQVTDVGDGSEAMTVDGPAPGTAVQDPPYYLALPGRPYRPDTGGPAPGPPEPDLPNSPMSNVQIRSLIRRLGTSSNEADKAYLNRAVQQYNAQDGFQITPDMVDSINRRYRSDTPGWQPRSQPTFQSVMRMRNPSRRAAYMRMLNSPQGRNLAAPDIGNAQPSPNQAGLVNAIVNGIGQLLGGSR